MIEANKTAQTLAYVRNYNLSHEKSTAKLMIFLVPRHCDIIASPCRHVATFILNLLHNEVGW